MDWLKFFFKYIKGSTRLVRVFAKEFFIRLPATDEKHVIKAFAMAKGLLKFLLMFIAATLFEVFPLLVID
jgi:hypothetical protein